MKVELHCCPRIALRAQAYYIVRLIYGRDAEQMDYITR